MFKTLALASLLTVAYAQSSASNGTATPSATTTSNPMIPTDASTSCQTFLTGLNADTTFGTCLKAMSGATSAFAPGSSSTISSAAVTSALEGLCAPSVDTACPESAIRTNLVNFFAQCSTELTTGANQDVIKIYDVLYSFLPMRTAACSKGDDGSWCVMAPTTNTRDVSEDVAGEGSSLGLSDILAMLYTDNSALKRRAEVSAIAPNTTTFHDTNLPFIFFKPDLDATKLCTTCARNALTAYIQFESNIPYGPGLGSSQILSSQSDLYNAVQTKCPPGFLQGAVQAAGALGGMRSAAPASHSAPKLFTASAVGALALFVSL